MALVHSDAAAIDDVLSPDIGEAHLMPTEFDQAGAWAELNPRQQLFVLGILEGKTQEVATLEAGYKDPSYGRQLIAKTHIRAAVQQGQREIGERNEVTQDWLVEKQLEILELALSPVHALMIRSCAS